MICTEWDEWLQNEHELVTIWTAELTDGTIVYQDDNRPGVEIRSAWTRLKHHCENNDVGIEFMRISFRKNIKDVGRGADAFFFCKSILGGMNAPRNVHYYIVGMVNDGVLRTVKWEVPPLLEHDHEERDIEQYKDCIIWKPGAKELWRAKSKSTSLYTGESESLLLPST